MSDALSKTIPIWCAVINRVLFPELKEAHKLCTPPRCISESEHDQIEQLIPEFVERFIALQLDVSALRGKITKPLRPLWVTQDTGLPAIEPDRSDTTAVILCTSSRRVTEGDVAADGYIQGAGDDNEHWSLGLTPDVFWKHRELLMDTNEHDMPEVIKHLNSTEAAIDMPAGITPTLVSGTASIYVAADSFLEQVETGRFSVVIHCSEQQNDAIRERLKTPYLHLKCRAGRTGSKDLRRELHSLSHLQESNLPFDQVLICCPTGTDLAVGAALYMICKMDAQKLGTGSESGPSALNKADSESLDKEFIRRRLAWISATQPSLKPSRATLLAVNDALLSGNQSRSFKEIF